jgi:hypothetical protein
MAKRRKSVRKSTRSARRSSRIRYEPPERVSVRFVGTEIDAAVARINDQASELPRHARIAAKAAVATLRICRRRIQAAICDAWFAKF